MAERSKALRSGRSLVLQAWVRIPLLTMFLFLTVFHGHYRTNTEKPNATETQESRIRIPSLRGLEAFQLDGVDESDRG